jgi:hypothetical protein
LCRWGPGYFYGSFLFLFQLTNDLFCSFLGYNCVTTTRQRRNDTATPPLRATARRVDNGNRNDDNGGENHNGTRGRERQRDDGAGNDDDQGGDEETQTAPPTAAVSICSQGGSLRETHAREQLLAGWDPFCVTRNRGHCCCSLSGYDWSTTTPPRASADSACWVDPYPGPDDDDDAMVPIASQIAVLGQLRGLLATATACL